MGCGMSMGRVAEAAEQTAIFLPPPFLTAIGMGGETERVSKKRTKRGGEKKMQVVVSVMCLISLSCDTWSLWDTCENVS